MAVLGGGELERVRGGRGVVLGGGGGCMGGGGLYMCIEALSRHPIAL